MSGLQTRMAVESGEGEHMSTGKPTFECTNHCGTPVARRGMCPACAAERREAALWARDVAARAAEARYEAIKAWIPQDRIWTEGEAVAAAGGCSTNVMRDTLRKMAKEGLIRMIPCRGWAAAGWVDALRGGA